MDEREYGRGSAGFPESGGSAPPPGDTEHKLRERARERTEEVRSAVREHVDDAKDTAREKGEQLRHRAEEKAEDMAARAGGRVAAVARALRKAGEELRDEGETRLATLTDDAAEQVDRFASYLENENPGRMLHDVERVARDNPAYFVGGTFALGMLAGRFLRSHRPDEEPSGPGRGNGGRGEGPGAERVRRPAAEGSPGPRPVTTAGERPGGEEGVPGAGGVAAPVTRRRPSEEEER